MCCLAPTSKVACDLEELAHQVGKDKVPTLHVILSKEEVQPEKIDANTIVVVFDVLLATTTIAAVLHYGATEVIPVMNGEEALELSEGLEDSAPILTGEYGGKTIEGFVDPLPTYLKDIVAGKTMVLSTTNGTVAIGNVKAAKGIYAAALINAEAVAEEIVRNFPHHKLLIVCAGGTMGRFAMEDFYGAGCFIDKLIKQDAKWELTDAANTALLFYQGNETKSEEILRNCETGKMMIEMGLETDILFASKQGIISTVPQYETGKMIVKG